MKISFEDKLLILAFAVAMFTYVCFMNQRDARLLRHCDDNSECYSYVNNR